MLIKLKLETPISTERLIHEIGTSFTLKPSKIGCKPVSALAAKSLDSKTKHFSTSYRINLRLLVTSRKCRPNKMLATI